jgi:hypothetical protein
MTIVSARIAEIHSRYEVLARVMDERRTRLWAAAEARALGRGGIAAVTQATEIRDKRIWTECGSWLSWGARRLFSQRNDNACGGPEGVTLLAGTASGRSHACSGARC